MRVRVASDNTVPGMHLVAFEGSWLSHPFWRKRFILSNDDVSLIHQSGVSAIFIDDEKGVSPRKSDTPSSSSALFGERLHRKKSAIEQPFEKLATDGEIDKARNIVAKSKRVVTQMFREARLGQAIQTEKLSPLVDEIADSITRNARAMVNVTRLKKKNEYTYLHSVAVCALMINLGRHLSLPEGMIRDIGMAGMLHDIGKMAVPETVLDKPGMLDDREFEIIRMHPEAGHDLIARNPDVPKVALDVCLHHHERMDGTGYPYGLRGDEISLYARMAAICDVYDAVTSRRPYKSAWSPTEALTKMLQWEGHFDPAVLQAFIQSIGIYPAGTLVQLRTNRLAVVIAGNDRDPMLPKVRAFYSTREAALLPFKDLIVTHGWTGDNIVSLENGESYFQSAWPSLLEQVLAGDHIAASTLLDARSCNLTL